jgi:hypothetical protein
VLDDVSGKYEGKPMEWRKSNRLVVTIILAGMLLAAGTGAGPQVGQGSEAGTAPQQQIDEGAPAGEVVASEEVVVATPGAAESESAAIVATARPELSATDPSTVSLASGRLQLVWFFAFW